MFLLSIHLNSILNPYRHRMQMHAAGFANGYLRINNLVRPDGFAFNLVSEVLLIAEEGDSQTIRYKSVIKNLMPTPGFECHQVSPMNRHLRITAVMRVLF